MNLVIFSSSDIIAPSTIQLGKRQAKHIYTVLRLNIGDTIVVGELNGKIGTGTITQISRYAVTITYRLTTDPPAPLPVTLLLALPRPNTLKKSIHIATSLGIKQIHLFHAKKVEKSYWQSHTLEKESLDKELLLGLEQAKDTLKPTLHFHRYFKRFVQNEFPKISENTQSLIAHPGNQLPSKKDLIDATQASYFTLIIGPEGGFNDYEVDQFLSSDVTPISLGSRILRTEFAIPTLVGALHLIR